MCNAWNHRPGCTCGWGGFNYGGSLTQLTSNASSALGTVASYTDPWASCPVCGAPVFFHQAPNGGRVFFDELGPPWPKHECTDRRTVVAGREPRRDREGEKQPPVWWRAGWRPVLKVESANLTPELMRIEGWLEEERVLLYVPRFYLRAMVDPLSELKTSPIQAQVSEPGVYRIEILGPGGRAFVLVAFSSMPEALTRAELKIPLRAPVRVIAIKKKRNPTTRR